MSIRSNPRTATPVSNNDSTPRAPINFKDEFVHSTAALAASHDETVSHILSRLDMLQAKIQTQPETNNNTTTAQPQRAAQRDASHISASMDQSVHSRLSSLESIHEDALHRLSSKLDQVERQLSVNKESESLMNQIASRLTQVEPRLQSHANLIDRVVGLESKLSVHDSKFHSQSDMHDRVRSLEAAAQPDPEQERILMRINSKLDILEDQQRNSRKSAAIMNSKYEPERRSSFEPERRNTFENERRNGYEREDNLSSSFEDRRSFDAGSSSNNNNSRTHLDADMDKQERAKYLQQRIEKLKELRGRYEMADNN
jgi:hypothetical protein